MQFDGIYNRKISFYRSGRCEGPRTYTYKKDGFRLIYHNKRYPCSFCGNYTNWGMIYFYPDERFKAWEKRNFHTYYICDSDEIPAFKASIVEDKINGSPTKKFTPSKMVFR